MGQLTGCVGLAGSVVPACRGGDRVVVHSEEWRQAEGDEPYWNLLSLGIVQGEGTKKCFTWCRYWYVHRYALMSRRLVG